MRTRIIANPASGSASELANVREALSGQSEIELSVTLAPAQASELAIEAVALGREAILAAGGDGTLHEIVAGLAAARMLDRVVVGVIPMGTGNDLARTLGIPQEPIEALPVLALGIERRIDLIEAKSPTATTFAVNGVAAGFSGHVDEALTPEMKATWGPLAFVGTAARVLPDLTGYRTTIAYDDGEYERAELLSVIVANGQTAAGGLRVAPGASPCDGLLDVVLVRYGSLLDLAAVAAALLRGNYLESDFVHHKRARRLRIASEPGMWVAVDGELFTKEPVSLAVLPYALRVFVSPEFAAAHDAAPASADNRA